MSRRIGFILCFLALVGVGGLVRAQPRSLTIVSYNVENLFSPRVDPPLNPDTAFTPEGEKHWTWHRFREKIFYLSRAIVSAAGWSIPDIIGLCEVENRWVLRDLIDSTPLANKGYRIIHKDSPDRRGIDVALLYRADSLRLISSAWFPLLLDTARAYYSRDLLHAHFLTRGGDSLHLIQCHWPSKRGGAARSMPRRQLAAARTRSIVDSIYTHDAQACIVVAGDFNDEIDSPVFYHLTDSSSLGPGLIPASPKSSTKLAIASYNYAGVWHNIDHFFVSAALISGKGLRASLPSRVSAPWFALAPEPRYGGFAPFRTYTFSYQGGVSDHLPIVLRLEGR